MHTNFVGVQLRILANWVPVNPFYIESPPISIITGIFFMKEKSVILFFIIKLKKYRLQKSGARSDNKKRFYFCLKIYGGKCLEPKPLKNRQAPPQHFTGTGFRRNNYRYRYRFPLQQLPLPVPVSAATITVTGTGFRRNNYRYRYRFPPQQLPLPVPFSAATITVTGSGFRRNNYRYPVPVSTATITGTPRTGREWWNCLARGGWPPSEALCDGLTLGWIEKSERQRMTRDWWHRDLRGYEPMRLDDDDPSWIRVTLPEFTLRAAQDVVFDMQDVECQFWKRGILFDFIELRRCD
jgi:hypothetical protein